MVRAPCCEKMGLKKGPWTPDEDHILVSFIHKNGHGNWRALPKLAGLLRCGKSCRLRWTNYLRPDIKRGNFSKEEEQTIIQLHEMLGNRWSAIAARLPGRTDNEIKNVWHTHLKKKLINNNNNKTSSHQDIIKKKQIKKSDEKKIINGSPQHSSSELSSVTADNNDGNDSPSRRRRVNNIDDDDQTTSTTATVMKIKNEVEVEEEEMEWSENYYNFPEIDESFWSEEILDSSEEKDLTATTSISDTKGEIINYGMVDDDHINNNKEEVDDDEYKFPFFPTSSSGGDEEEENGMDFWYDLFIRAGDRHLQPDQLPEF